MEITKCFDKKKRNLSSNTNGGENSKRPKESSVDNCMPNAINADVFAESLQSEDCVAILHSCMKKLQEEMKKVLQMCEKAKDSQIKGKIQLN